MSNSKIRIRRNIRLSILTGAILIISLLICIYDYKNSSFHYSEYRPTIPLDSLIYIGRLKYLPQKITPFNGSVYRDFKNGQNELKGSYLKGEKHGFWQKWYENGGKKEESNYKYGKKIAKYITWYENGQIENEKYFAFEKKPKKERFKMGSIGAGDLILLFLIISIIVFIVFYTKKDNQLKIKMSKLNISKYFRLINNINILAIIGFVIFLVGIIGSIIAKEMIRSRPFRYGLSSLSGEFNIEIFIAQYGIYIGLAGLGMAIFSLFISLRKTMDKK